MTDLEKRLKPFIIQTLRRASYRWPERNEALKAARVDRGLYKCASCEKTYGRKEVHIDHISPVVPVTGFTSWDLYIERMFCAADQLQILCELCHSVKSLLEREQRKIHKRNNKEVVDKRSKKR